MSRAFIKENDLEHAGIDIPERPISLETNYVTPAGLKNLQSAIDNLDKEREDNTPVQNTGKEISWAKYKSAGMNTSA